MAYILLARFLCLDLGYLDQSHELLNVQLRFLSSSMSGFHNQLGFLRQMVTEKIIHGFNFLLL